MNKKTKWLVTGACALVLVGGGLAYASVGKQKENASAQTETTLRKSTIKDAEKSVLALYSNDKKEDFAKELTTEKINDAKIKVKKIDDKKIKEKLTTELSQIDFMLETKQSIQAFIPNDILKDDVTGNDINELSNKYEKSLTYNKKITEKNKLYLDGITQQFNDIKVANEKTTALFSDETKEHLADNVNEQLLDESKDLISVIKNEKAKNEVIATHEIATKLFTEKQEAEKVVAEKSETEQTEAEQTNTTTNGTSENSGGTGTGNNSNSTANSSPSSNNTNLSAPAQQGGIEGLIASSPTGQRTDQIVGVVANGSSATVYLFEKNGGQWQTILSSGGHVGSMGVGSASESVSRTPKGSYSLGFAFGTSNPGTQLPFRAITPNSYWISNVNDPAYNTWQERPSSDPADEHLSDYPVQYQYAIVINYNNGVGGGSGFFLHCDNGAPTAGCVSVPTGTMATLMQRIHSGASIINVNSQNELANY